MHCDPSTVHIASRSEARREWESGVAQRGAAEGGGREAAEGTTPGDLISSGLPPPQRSVTFRKNSRKHRSHSARAAAGASSARAKSGRNCASSLMNMSGMYGLTPPESWHVPSSSSCGVVQLNAI